MRMTKINLMSGKNAGNRCGRRFSMHKHSLETFHMMHGGSGERNGYASDLSCVTISSATSSTSSAALNRGTWKSTSATSRFYPFFMKRKKMSRARFTFNRSRHPLLGWLRIDWEFLGLAIHGRIIPTYYEVQFGVAVCLCR